MITSPTNDTGLGPPVCVFVTLMSGYPTTGVVSLSSFGPTSLVVTLTTFTRSKLASISAGVGS